jgi:hypothetical protein
MANRVAFDKQTSNEDERILNKMRNDPIIKQNNEKDTVSEITAEEKENYMRSKSHFKTVKYRSNKLNLGPKPVGKLYFF